MSAAPRPLDSSERIFTHRDAVEITRVPALTLNNWTQRGLLGDIGQVNRRTGRRMYSFPDLIKLRIVGDLVTVCGASPGLASVFADKDRAIPANSMFDLDAEGRFGPRLLPPPQQDYIMAWAELSEDKFTIRYVKGEKLFEVMAKTPHPILLVPVDVIAHDVLAACYTLLNEEGPPE